MRRDADRYRFVRAAKRGLRGLALRGYSMRKLSVRSGWISIISFSGPTARLCVKRICTHSSLWFCFCRRTVTQPAITWGC